MSSAKLIAVYRAAASCTVVPLTLFCASAVASRELPRRAFLGVTAQATPGDQVRVSKIFPDSSAARSALAVGDILLALNGTAIRSVDGFLAGVRSSKSGDRLIYHVRRDGKEMDVEVVLAELPREQPSDIQVLYDTVETRDATVQSILTIPIGNTSKLPSILFVQGWDCGSVEWPLPGQNLSRELVYGANSCWICCHAQRKERSRRWHRHAVSGHGFSS